MWVLIFVILNQAPGAGVVAGSVPGFDAVEKCDLAGRAYHTMLTEDKNPTVIRWRCVRSTGW